MGVIPDYGFVYQGELHAVDIPEGTIIANIVEGTPETTVQPAPIGSGGETKTVTTTPLTIIFAPDPKAAPPPPPDVGPLFDMPSSVGEFVDRLNPFSPTRQEEFIMAPVRREQAAIAYAVKEDIPIEAARQAVTQAEIQQNLTRSAVAVGFVSIVAAPVAAAVGGGLGLGVQQVAKTVQGGGVVTVDEAIQGAGFGAGFSVLGGAVMGQATKAVPVLGAKTLMGATARIGASTLAGTVVGSTVGAGEAAIMGGDVAEAAKTGAMMGAGLGLAFGVGGEIVGFGRGWVERQYNRVANSLSPERAMYNRVVGQGGEGGPLGNVGGGSPSERALYDRVVANAKNPTVAAERVTAPTDVTATKIGLGTKVANILSPERALYNRITSIAAKPSSSGPTFGGGGSGNVFTSGKGGLMSVVKTVKAPMVKAPMKPLPVQLKAWEVQLTPPVIVSLVKPTTTKSVTVAKQTTTTVSAEKAAPMLKVDTKQATPTASLSKVEFNPSIWQGSPFISRRGRTRIREESAPIFDYPDAGLGHPEKLSEKGLGGLSVATGVFQGQTGGTPVEHFKTPIGLGSTKNIGKTDTGLNNIGKADTGLKDIGKGGFKPIFDTSTVADTTPIEDIGNVPDVVQEFGQDTRQGIRQRNVSFETFRGYMPTFEFPSGPRHESRRVRRGYGSKTRVYPIVTGRQVLEGFLKSPKQKRKHAHKVVRKGKK